MESVSQDQVLKFFLNLFAHQCGASSIPPSEASVRFLEKNKSGDSVFELGIKLQGAWRNRRMSIRPLGEQVESKSMCFKVIYDEMLVVKIPPKPITDFDDYLEAIGREHFIAQKISKNIACVYPTLGAILKKIPEFKETAGLPGHEAETIYISKLKAAPQLHKYLKIGPGFVFFMSLAKYMFFNQVINSIHDIDKKIEEEILVNASKTVDDIQAFEILYGHEHEAIFFDINSFFNEYLIYMDKLAKRHDIAAQVADFEKKEWFFQKLANVPLQFNKDYLPPSFCKNVQTVIDKLFARKEKEVSRFKSLIEQRTRTKAFESNKSRMRGLIIALLELLRRLSVLSVAIRDLKPDNMFIDTFLDGADHILADPSAFGLGLIDLETAVFFGVKQKKDIIQPLLAGTPSYATPSHLFPNRVLLAIYKEIYPYIFLLQDWYACLGMIYTIITGQLLFTKTGRLLPEIIRAKRNMPMTREGILGFYEKISFRFWNSACNEFTQKIDKAKTKLDAVEMELPDELCGMLQKAASIELKILASGVKKRIAACPIAPHQKQKLIKADTETLTNNLSYWKNPRTPLQVSSSVREEVIRLIEYLIDSKKHEYELKKAPMRFRSSVSCTFLMGYLFNRIYHALYDPVCAKNLSLPPAYDITVYLE